MDVSRRSAVALGLTVAAMPSVSLTTPAIARTYAPDEGKEIAPGVRVVELGTREAMISAYKSILILDVVFQPGAATPEAPMDNDMVCHITAGEFDVVQGDMKFMVKEGDMYTCGKGKPEKATNTSSVVGVHRIAILMPA